MNADFYDKSWSWAKAQGYESFSEYVRQLIREDQEANESS